MSEGLAKELERDPKARKRIAELLATDPDVRLAIINAIMADVATKRDLAELRAELRADMERLRAEVMSEIDGVRSELRGEIGQLRAEVMGEIHALRSEMRSEMGQLRSEIGQLRAEMRSELGQLRSEMGQLRAEASSNFRWTIGTILIVWGATVIPILLRLIGAI